MRAPLIHIGYNKTGTTWLQEELFPRKEIGFQCLLELSDRQEINRNVVKQHSLSFSGEQILAHYRKRLAEPGTEELLPVITCERFSGDPHSGGYDSREIADRLHKLWPEARILIVVREQQSMLLSTYRQYVRAGGPRTLKAYFHPPERGSRRVPMFDPDYFCYDLLVDYYQTLFGRDRVLVLPYEWLRSSPEKYVRQIVDFCGLNITDGQIASLPFGQQINKGYGRLALGAKRFYNRFFLDNSLNPAALIHLPGSAEKLFVTFWRNIDRLFPASWQKRKTKRMKEYIAKETGNRYAESNRRLALLSGLPMEELGYQYLLSEPTTHTS